MVQVAPGSAGFVALCLPLRAVRSRSRNEGVVDCSKRTAPPCRTTVPATLATSAVPPVVPAGMSSVPLAASSAGRVGPTVPGSCRNVKTGPTREGFGPVLDDAVFADVREHSQLGGSHRFRFTTSCSISSLFVMTRLFAWKPRWATIMFVNSCARSTFDISSAPLVMKDWLPSIA